MSARILIAVVRPPLLVLGFVFGNLYKLCFSWLDKSIAKQNEKRFAEDIHKYLSFIFAEHKAEIIPNVGTPFPPKGDVMAIGIDKITKREFSFDDRVMEKTEHVSHLLNSYIARMMELTGGHPSR